MEQDIIIKCSNEEHSSDANLVCFNEYCKENRLYCLQCKKNGMHSTHPESQYELPDLFRHNKKTEQECDDLIIRLNELNDQKSKSYDQLIEGIRNKYQRSKEQFLNLNSNQKNQFIGETFLFKTFQNQVEQKMKESSKYSQEYIQQLYQDLNLQLFEIDALIIIQLNITQLNYSQELDQDIQKSEELYQKGYKLGFQCVKQIIYWDDHNYQEALKIFDQSLICNSKHQLALFCKSECLICIPLRQLIYGCLVNIMKRLYVQINHQRQTLNISFHYILNL